MKRALRYGGRVHKDLRRLAAETQARILVALEAHCAASSPVRTAFP